MQMGRHNQLPLHSHTTHMFVNCKVNLYIVGIFCFYLTGHGLKILSQNYFSIQYLYTK